MLLWFDLIVDKALTILQSNLSDYLTVFSVQVQGETTVVYVGSVFSRIYPYVFEASELNHKDSCRFFSSHSLLHDGKHSTFPLMERCLI